MPPNTGDPQNEGFDLKDIFLPEYLDEASNKDWSENAKLFRQFNDWVSMLRVLREARYLKSVINVEKRKASQTSSCYSSLSSSSSPAGAAGPAEKKKKFTPPLMKKMALLDAPRNPATLEAQMSLLSAEEEEDLDSPYMHATYSENVLAAVRIRKALIAGDFAGISAFPNLRAAIETAPAPEKAGAPCLTMYGRTVCVLDKEQTTIGRCKEGEKPPDVDLSALFGDLCRKVISHLHATIVCKNKEARKFVLCVNGRNGLFVDGLHRPHGDSITLRNGMQITIGLLPFVYVNLPLKK